MANAATSTKTVTAPSAESKLFTDRVPFHLLEGAD